MKVLLFFTLTLIASCIIRNNPAQRKFITYEHRLSNKNLLIHKITDPSWKIAYRYGAECKPNDRGARERLEAAVTTALNTWLQPLRDLKPANPITNVFHFQQQKDFNGDMWTDVEELLAVDARVTFRCKNGFSFTSLSAVPPDVFTLLGAKLTPALLSHLTHELGHAFGLVDTYVGNIYGSMSSGGLAGTVGRQPSSVMAVLPTREISTGGEILTGIDEDDKRGIIWLYKRFYENIDLEDCFFPDYVLEKEPLGCRPKHPLIFEVKHSRPRYALRLLDEDPSTDVNAQNVAGMTALHYAVMYEKTHVVKKLLEHKDIKPGLKDKQGRTALDIAREAGLDRMLELLQAVTPQQVVEDLNSDGMVNILDLVVVATNFGEKGKNIADVDGNGVVNILDLVRVAGAFGSDTSSAPLHPEVAKLVTNTQVNRWLIAARQQVSADPAYRRGIFVLEQLLTRNTPQQTVLLANYPNPFNPETWLPYQLAKPAKVTLLIHAVDGKLVRKMALGDLPAGVYQSKSRAAHWDGRNAHGEPAASGIYFYTLSAGDVTATRKMLLRK